MKTTRVVAASAALTLAVGIPGLAAANSDTASTPGRRLDVVGLTDGGKLVRFNSAAPQFTRSLGAVKGLVGDVALVGIDYRVQDGKLYGVGNAGGIYTIDTSRWKARATKVSQLTVALQGTRFGVDFNPAANRLRVISDTGQNLRHNIDDPAGTPAAGTTTADGTLTYPGPPPMTATGVTAAAYTNNDLDPATATTLFDIDTMLDQVVVQSPANAGQLAATGKLTVDAGTWAGFDISSRQSSGTTVANRGLATLGVSGWQRLFRINLLTGKATDLGRFPGSAQVVDLAIPLAQY
jgi:hypothetical protein